MKLYFIPFACSLATRIAVTEAELDAEFVPVGHGAALPDGRAFTEISPMGYVPALETEGGLLLTEGPAVLSYIADLAAEGVLAPPLISDDRYRMLSWLNFVATELHKAVFAPIFKPDTPEALRDAARAKAPKPLDILAAHLAGRATLVDGFTVADAYLVTVLNWCEAAAIDIARWPALLAWRTATRRRPSVAAAMAVERPLLAAA